MSDAPHPTDVRVGRLLRERRLALGISQERLGALLGVTYQQVQKYERGANRIGSSRMHDLCRVLGVRASYFFDEPEAAGLAEAAPSGFDLTGASGTDLPGREAQELLAAFRLIGDPEIRRRLVDLARALAGRGTYPGAGNT
jgi:transcriptional regulator with XRE-family HTH domain